MSEEEATSPRRAKRRLPRVRVTKRRVLVLFALVLVGGIVFLGYQYKQTRDELNRAKNPEQAAKQEAEDVLSEVKQYLEVPTDEQPTSATVTDKSRLQSQPFFERAENGDKVLVFTKAQLAILYRPSTKKVILFAPIDATSESPSTGTQQ